MDELERDYESDLGAGGGGINFIPCIKFVRRGVAKAQPNRIQLNPEDLAAAIENAQADLNQLEEEDKEDESDNIEEDNEDGDESQQEPEDDENPSEGEEDIDKKYDLENYDDDEDKPSALFNLKDLVADADPRKDPYLKDSNVEDDESDVEDVIIKPTDNLILVGHVEGDASVLEVYVYNDVEADLYVHHEILLSSFPLAMEWLSFDPVGDSHGNFVAVGTMMPVIEIWDIDTIDVLEPHCTLGQTKSKKRKVKGSGHSDAVLSLSWNKNADHILASGSVDETVLLWDLSKQSIASSITSHKEKIQALQWHPFEAQTLLSGCCDGHVNVFDCRGNNSYRSWKANGEVERVLWNHFNPFTFLSATDKGIVQMFDVRQEKKSLWTLSAHPNGVNGMVLSSQCPDCLVTVSSDKEMKVWDISDMKPNNIHSQAMKLGELHSLDGCPDAPFVVCMGGDKSQDNLKVLDIRESASVRECFGNRPLQNPLGAQSFGFATANEAEDVDEEMEDAIATLSVESQTNERSGGAIAKFKKKEKERKQKKKKKKF